MPASLKHLTDKKLNLSSLLAKWKDGLFYSAIVIKVDKNTKRCLVSFEDGSEIWLQNRDLHIQLSLDELGDDDDIVCSVCDDGASEPPNEIIICDICQQGYHQKCHTPPVDSSKIDETDTDDHKDWFCATCSYILNQSNTAFLVATNSKTTCTSGSCSSSNDNNISSTSTSSNNNNSSNNDNNNEVKQHAKSQSQASKVATTNKRQAPSRVGDRVSNDSLVDGGKAETAATKTLASASHSSAPKAPCKPVTTSASRNNGVQNIQSQKDVDQGSSKDAATAPSNVKAPATNNHIKSVASSSAPLQNAQKLAGDAVCNKQCTSPPITNTNTKNQLTTSISELAKASTSISSPSNFNASNISSALTVGGSAGRTKQDVVEQSNRQKKATVECPTLSSSPITVKHAVRKSSINFVMPPNKQSALPIATRSIPGTAPAAKVITTPTKQPVTSIAPTTPLLTAMTAATSLSNSASSSPRLVSPASTCSISSPSSSSMICGEPKTVAVVTNHRTVESHKSLLSPGAKTLTVVRPAPLSMGLSGSIVEKSISATEQHQPKVSSSTLCVGQNVSDPEVKKIKRSGD